METTKVPQKTAECAALHINAFYEQCADNRAADTGEPCAKCKYWEVCNFDWSTTLKPLFDGTGIKVSLCRPRTKKR